MKPLRLFTAFHANLDFSALPDADRATVIARCYWPLLRLPEEWGIPIGFEMSARTLRTLLVEDPEWVKRFRGLAERGLVEPIASGWAQVVAPLAPVEVNEANLALGREAYREVLGFEPETYFVSEQTFSDGLVELYRDAGTRRVVMEWNNPASVQPALRALRCQPARLFDSAGDGPAVLWNDSIVFQKMQRIAHGQIPPSELTRLVDRLAAHTTAESLCLYGGDVEIFDYRPSRSLPTTVWADHQERDAGEADQARADARDPHEDSGSKPREIDRLLDTFRRFAEDPRFEFVLPRELADDDDLLPRVRLGSAADPIPCKKQPRYNPTRWAVSGRDGFGMNTRCQALLQIERAATRLATNRQASGSAPAPASAAASALASVSNPASPATKIAGAASAASSADARADLVDLWRSDFRTRATEEKIGEFETRIGLATQRNRERLGQETPRLVEGEDVLVANPHDRPWQRMPVEIPLRLPAGACRAFEVRTRRGPQIREQDYQVEVLGRHRDGSIRDATLVLLPDLEARSLLTLSLQAVSVGELDPTAESDLAQDAIVSTVSTEQVTARFLPHRGAAIESLAFPAVQERPLLGTIPHGHFDAIEYTPDFYSGHVVVALENGQKVTDLRPTTLHTVTSASGAVRTTLEARSDSSLGPWRKRYRLYRQSPRIDVIHDLAFHDARIASLRLGLFSCLPDAWDRHSLEYRTINGGRTVESRSIHEGLSLAQSRAVSSSVTATSCLGATEGWVALRDARQGVLIQGDRGEAAVAPLLDFEDVDEDFFLRLSHTAAESDETRATFMRGRRRFGFAVEGFCASDAEAERRARLRHEGLVYRTEAGIGLSTGL